MNRLHEGYLVNRATDRFLEDCPRCGLMSCENDGQDRYCPNCFFYEPISRNESSLSTPTSEDSPNIDDETETLTLGELADCLPDDCASWILNFENERFFLKMTALQNDDNENYNINQEKKEYPPYELVAYPNEERGTTWIKHGVAWFTKDGKRLRIKLFMDKPLPEDGKLLLVESLRSSYRQQSEETPF